MILILNHDILIYCNLTRNVLQHVPSDIKVPYSSKGAVCSKCDVLIQGVNICVNGLCGHG